MFLLGEGSNWNMLDIELMVSDWCDRRTLQPLDLRTTGQARCITVERASQLRHRGWDNPVRYVIGSSYVCTYYLLNFVHFFESLCVGGGISMWGCWFSEVLALVGSQGIFMLVARSYLSSRRMASRSTLPEISDSSMLFRTSRIHGS